MPRVADRRGLRAWIGAATMAIASAAAGAEPAGEPPASGEATVESERTAAEVVDRLHRCLIDAARLGVDVGSGGGFEARRETIRDVVLDSFDFPVVCRLVLGEHWKRLEADDRDRFCEAFRRMVVASYAAEFKSFSGQRFEPGDAREQRAGLEIVRSVLVVDEDTRHEFAYQVRESGGRWRIVNVAVDGVSDLALKRSQYATVLRDEGIVALIERLEARTAEFARGRTADE